MNVTDFERFDLVLAMDEQNLARLQRLCPPGRRERVRLLMSFAGLHGQTVVPDPYYGDAEHFEEVLDLVERACDGLVAELKQRLSR